MKEELILTLSELRSQINDTIMRVEKEDAVEGKEMVSALMSCELVNVYDLLKEETDGFLEYMENIGFIRTERENVYRVGGSPFTQYKIVSIHDWIEFSPGIGWKCHPALIALYKNYLKNI